MSNLTNLRYDQTKGIWVYLEDSGDETTENIEYKIFAKAYNGMLKGHPIPPEELLKSYVTPNRITRDVYRDSWDIASFKHNTYTIDFQNFEYVWNKYNRQLDYEKTACAVYDMYDVFGMGYLPPEQYFTWQLKVNLYKEYLAYIGFINLKLTNNEHWWIRTPK